MSDDLNDERALVDRMAQGDAAALEVFYRLHGTRAWSLARRVVRDDRDAEDVVQEAFLELWRSATRYDPRKAEPVAWLTAIVRTRGIDRLRQRAVRQRTVDKVSRDESEVAPASDALHESAEVSMRVREAMRTLPAEQAEVLTLAYQSGLSQSEIADVTATPLGTVKTRARLAMRKLAELLSELR